MRLRLCCAATALVLVFALVGCGDDSSTASNEQAAAITPTETTEVVRYTNRLAKPRTPGPHPNASVDQLVVKDIRVGSGPEIESGDRGVFDFIGANWITGEPLDDSWGRRRPFETTIEHNVVIDGWWQGIPGMRVGGRRTILVPPALGFTQSLMPGLNGATTYFDVVLLQVNPARPRGMEAREADQVEGATTG